MAAAPSHLESEVLGTLFMGLSSHMVTKDKSRGLRSSGLRQ